MLMVLNKKDYSMKKSRRKYKPGPGWHYIGIAPVAEHTSGVRVHAHGMYRLPVGDIQEIPEPELSLYRRICNGHYMRAVMAWCRDHVLVEAAKSKMINRG